MKERTTSTSMNDHPETTRPAPARDASEWTRVSLVSRAVYACSKLLSRAAAVVFFDYRSRGAALIPRRGATIVASNHQSFLDPVLVGIAGPRALHFMARDTLFAVPGMRQLLVWLHTLPIPRDSAASRRGIELGRAALALERGVVLFPEGTRSATGERGPLKRGLDLVTRSIPTQVVPALVAGSFDAWPRDRKFPHPSPIRVAFGRPITAGNVGISGNVGVSGSSGDQSREAHAAKKIDGANLLSRLETSYQSLEARAAGIRRVESARMRGWTRFQATFFCF